MKTTDSQKKPFYKRFIIWNFLGFMKFVVALSFLLLFFKYVSIGEWVARENYDSLSEWIKQLGIFIAVVWVMKEMLIDYSDLMLKGGEGKWQDMKKI